MAVIEHMIRKLCILALVSAATLLRAEVPQLLGDALQKMAKDTDRWAYTQTLVEKDDKGKTVSVAVVRFDPSKPYAEQYKPLAIDGKTPSDSQLRKYRKMGEKRGTQMEKEGVTQQQKTVGELMDVDHATVATEDAKTITYDVPLKKEGNDRLPPDKFRVTARINKASATFENVAATLRAPMREKLVLKIKSGEGNIDFTQVDPKYAPQPTAVRGNAMGSVMFVTVGRNYDLKREDFQRVRPYGDRFQVQIGPLKAIDF